MAEHILSHKLRRVGNGSAGIARCLPSSKALPRPYTEWPADGTQHLSHPISLVPSHLSRVIASPLMARLSSRKHRPGSAASAAAASAAAAAAAAAASAFAAAAAAALTLLLLLLRLLL
jgi:hypothetical protein